MWGPIFVLYGNHYFLNLNIALATYVCLIIKGFADKTIGQNIGFTHFLSKVLRGLCPVFCLP